MVGVIGTGRVAAIRYGTPVTGGEAYGTGPPRDDPPAEAVLTLDPGGRVRGTSAGAARVVRFRAQDIVGRHLSCLYPRGEAASGAAARALAAAARYGGYTENGWRVRADGSWFRAATVITAIRDEAARLSGFCVTIRDAEESRRRAAPAARDEEALRSAAREEAARRERQRLARELHDSVSQTLYAIALGARTARELLDRRAGEAAEPIDRVRRLADTGLAETRSLILRLRPEALETEGLVAALTGHADVLRTRYGMRVDAVLGPEPRTAPEAKYALHRIAQEALHNVAKHADARHVLLRLLDGPRTVTLVVTDDGAGFDPHASFPGHLGLRSMRERAEEVGGTLRVESRPGHGSSVLATVPSRA